MVLLMLGDAANLKNENAPLLAFWHFLLSVLLCSFYLIHSCGFRFWNFIVKGVQCFTVHSEALIIKGINIFKGINGFHSLSVDRR